eukprot:3635853-Alexandrium_andersonii.AAC.1
MCIRDRAPPGGRAPAPAKAPPPALLGEPAATAVVAKPAAPPLSSHVALQLSKLPAVGPVQRGPPPVRPPRGALGLL